MKSTLAIHGGPKVRTTVFPVATNIGKEEEQAVVRVVRSGVLSRYLGCWHKDFYGGDEVRALEQEWAAFYQVKHAMSVNSATSGLYAAVGACGIGPGDEVIVPPYTMSATVMGILVYGAIPVFADIEADYLCLDPRSIEKNITSKTKAIIVVDLFGSPYNAKVINLIAKKHKLWVIEDAAQAPGATYKGKFAATLGDIGIHSLNYHKHIHTGEGGVVVTNNDTLAERVQLIRNHAESVVEDKGVTDLTNMVGFNFRMTELEAAVARKQLKKLPSLLKKRLAVVRQLEKAFKAIPCITPISTRPDTVSVFYDQVLFFDQKKVGVHRDTFLAAVCAELMPIGRRETEGIPLGGGYVKPLYLLPMFQHKIAFGASGHPWSTFKSKVRYDKGICPVVEKMHEETLITNGYVQPEMTQKDVDDVVQAFKKVWERRQEL